MSETGRQRLDRAGCVLSTVLGAWLAATVPASAAPIYVTTTVQKVGGPGGCSLQEAVYSANLDSNVLANPTDPSNPITTDCEPGSGGDSIFLPESGDFVLDHAIDDPQNGLGPTATPIIDTPIEIFANGSTLTHQGTSSLRVFAVGTGGSLTVHHAHVVGFTVKGGNGRGGGGGGLGAGGAVFVLNGRLVVDSCTFQGNGALGGHGSAAWNVSYAGGGGGGLGGNGGDGGPDGVRVGGGGGGGSRGNGADGRNRFEDFSASGGGGGGSVEDGQLSIGGILHGGNGASAFYICFTFDNNGHPGDGPGGGGGGGASDRDVCQFTSGNGGMGALGGGGGGAGSSNGSGGDGGFGGGGGASSFGGGVFGPDGGDGGFGGGGGASRGGDFGGGHGDGGPFGGDADDRHGGGGAALGGAIFNVDGDVTVVASTFTGNFVAHGLGGGGDADNGRDAGGAIFSVGGSLEVRNCTIAGNEATGAGGGVVAHNRGDGASFILFNTIISGNGATECSLSDGKPVSHEGAGNLIPANDRCLGIVSPLDPLLDGLALNAPGTTPTMAIDEKSPAFNAGDADECSSLDQRGILRPQLGGCDIGAYELSCSQLSCPGDVVQANDAGACGAAVTYPAPTVVDGTCTPDCDAASGSYFDVGATEVTCAVGSTTCSFVVTVNDAERPTVTAPAGVNVGNDPGRCYATVDPGTGSPSDNCPGATVAGVRGDGAALTAPYPVGTTTISWTATDVSGNTSATAATQSVRVNDVEPPALGPLSTSPSVLWPPNHRMVNDTVAYAVTDNCPGTVCGLSVVSSEPVNGLGDGDTAPDWIVGDAHHAQLRAERSGLGDGRTYTVRATCSDDAGNAATGATTVRVAHEIAAPASGSLFPARLPVTFAGRLLDRPGSVHTVEWGFDALRATAAPTTSELVATPWTFDAPGVYAVRMTASDAAGQTGIATTARGLDAFVVIHPAAAPYVAGGGWIASPAGALAAQAGYAGKASFGFVSTSARSGIASSGETEFDLHVPGFQFNAVNFESQTIAGGMVVLRGTGKVNGKPPYKFQMTVIDGDPLGGGQDRFRIRIWNASTGAVVYDNERGAPEGANPTTPVGAGSRIVILR